MELYSCGTVQFISLDDARSNFDDSDYGMNPWKDYKIAPGKQIRTVETIWCKGDGLLCGFNWLDDDGSVLISCGPIFDPILRNDPSYVFQSFTLNHNQRLVGIKSGGEERARGRLYSFSWVICTAE